MLFKIRSKIGLFIPIAPPIEDDINVEHTKAHFIYANKMGEKYLKRYKKYFHDPDIREFDMQHEQWLFGEEKYAIPVLKAIDEFMQTPV